MLFVDVWQRRSPVRGESILLTEGGRSGAEEGTGSDYPRGLKGENIIFEARILAVADVVETMVSHRPYRPVIGPDKALAEIERHRAPWYDPAAVDACLRLFREEGFRFG